jgi:hypothetical protein
MIAPLYPVLRRLAPGAVTSTVNVGRAMIGLTLHGGPGLELGNQRILESRDINAIDPEAATTPTPRTYAEGMTIGVRLVKAGRMKLAYDATVRSDDGVHVVVEAPFANDVPHDVGPVTFAPGDVFTEHYWTDRWYSVKEVRDPAGALKGWYCDVTRPVVRKAASVYSDDLDLDLWVSGNLATIVRLDEDEFVASGLPQHDPFAATHARAALDTLAALAAERFASVLGERAVS